MNTNKTQAKQFTQDAVMQSVLKASDLRTGNKLLFLGDVVTFKNITEIRDDGIFWIKTFEPIIESKNFHFKPIPLTEDLCLKFGFKEVYKNCFEIFSGLYLNIEKKCFDSESDFFPAYTEYVHELQNLYFALTGSELTVA